jgi:hypothetical protein
MSEAVGEPEDEQDGGRRRKGKGKARLMQTQAWFACVKLAQTGEAQPGITEPRPLCHQHHPFPRHINTPV